MIRINRTTSANADFVRLVAALDAYLTIVDGKQHDFYHQYNGIEKLQHVVVAYLGDTAVGCGAMKEVSPGVMEIKRMYTDVAQRGKGIAGMVLRELELWAKELCYTSCVLETGRPMQDAVALYMAKGYTVIDNYGPYVGVDNSICFEKQLQTVS